MLATIVFDMGNVLVHFSHAKMCVQMAEVCGVTRGEMERQLIDSGLQWNFERGRLSPQQLHQQAEALFERTLDFEALRLAASDIFQLNAPIVPVLDALKARGHRLVLLSNTSIWHFEFIRERFDVLDRFDDYVLSYEAGAIKPEAPIFEATLAQLQCPPGEAFYTDDIPLYVETGRQYGLQAEVFTDVPQLLRHLQQRGVTLSSG